MTEKLDGAILNKGGEKMLSVKLYIRITGFIVCIVGFVHLFRLLGGWVIVINGWTMPLWLSILGVVGPWYLAYNAWVLAKKIKNK